MENKQLENLIRDLRASTADLANLDSDSAKSISSVLSNIQLLPDFVEKSAQDLDDSALLKELIQELKYKTSNEYISGEIENNK